VLELLVGTALAAGAVWFVLKPVFRPPVDLPGVGRAEPGGELEGEDPDDDMSPRAVALRALGEIEFDRATGKLSDTDYESLKASYTAQALAAMRTTSGEPAAVRPAAVHSPASGLACPIHGSPAQPDAVFCSVCGRRLGAAPGFCLRCGSAVAPDARYCHACGAGVAA